MKKIFTIISFLILFPCIILGAMEDAELVVKPGGKSFLDPSGRVMETRDLVFRDTLTGEEKNYYIDDPDLTSLTRLRILLEEASSLRETQNISLINFTEMTRMLTFMRENPPADCIGFAHAVGGVPYVFEEFDKRNWAILKVDVRANILKNGDVIALTKDTELDEPLHFAIYLGEDLFISKYGPDGKLIVTTLEAMEEVFRPEHVLLIKPR